MELLSSALLGVAQDIMKKQFLEAAMQGQTMVVRSLLSNGVDAKCKNDEGENAMHFAAKDGHIEIMIVLLSHGCPLNAETDLCKTTPMHYAAFGGQFNSVKWLIENGANPLAEDWEGDTPAHEAYFNGHPELGMFIFRSCKHTASTIHDAMMWGIRTDNSNTVQNFLMTGADPNSVGNFKLLPVQEATILGRTTIMKILLERGANMNVTRSSSGYSGCHLLHLSVRCGNNETTKFLLEAGASVNLKTSDGHNAIHLAAMNGRSSGLDLLVEWGADLEAANKEGDTPASLAGKNGCNGLKTKIIAMINTII
ncbi:unnamed protein product [Meganyctiphanes norvegica]|uniref:Uncharacterized protein n=1 Tax=Meganyctiphanes norvegica TaxID=48144 RepID=A0AAV2QQ96_MEGNR